MQQLRSALAGYADEELLSPLRTAGADPDLPRAGHRAGKYGRVVSSRLADLDQLALLARGCQARGRFLSELTLDPPASTSDLAGPPLLDEDYLILSTIHSAKGLEWDAVHVIHATDGCIPSDMATGDDDELEEERRLLYVALTRARDELTIASPQRYYRRQKPRDDVHMYAVVSRFLNISTRYSTHLDEASASRST